MINPSGSWQVLVKVIAVIDINDALNGMRFDPTANYNGSATLMITTDDQGNIGTAGAQSDANTVGINVITP